MNEPNGNGNLSAEQVEALVRAEIPGLKIDQGKIKLREWDALEDKTGREVVPWVGADGPPIWFMQGVLWLWLRRTHPGLTFEALGEIDLALLFEASGQRGETVDPTEPGGEPQTPPPSPASATSGE
jgi:hypothetical protein